jgi:hypothetical protein
VIAPEIVILPVVFTLVSSVVITRMRLNHRERMAALQRPSDDGSRQEERLAQLESAVEALTVEVEHVAEAQRFMTKLLAETRPEVRDAFPRMPETDQGR